MKLKLILPNQKKMDNGVKRWNGKFPSFVYGVKRYPYANLALPIIASLTPTDIDVAITDESVEVINFNEEVDVVGITAPTALAIRAYEIADEFRKRSVTVVIGGMHASVLPEEAIQHADSVVIGEAESIWGGLIDDYKKGKLKQFYKSEARPDIGNQPIPRWDLLKNDSYSYHTIQTTRGCPYDCEFCTVKPFFGSKYRCKPVEKVIMEVEYLLNIGKKRLFFIDDNFIGNKKCSKKLMKALMAYKLKYVIQASINVAKDGELLELLAESGCEKVLIGIESISSKTIEHMNKNSVNHIEEYYRDIEVIQSYGIAIYGSFVMGNDTDDCTIFKKTVDFVNGSNMESAVFNLLTPFPSTRLGKRLAAEGRVLHRDWAKYDVNHVCIEPKLMSQEELLNGYIWTCQQVYSYEAIFKRLEGLWSLWNKNKVRYDDRVSPIIVNLSGNNSAQNYPPAEDPVYFRENSVKEVSSSMVHSINLS